MSLRYETFPIVDHDKSKPSFIGRIKEFMRLLVLLLLSFIILAFALFISLFASSFLGIIFALQETKKYLKNLFQKEKCFSSLLSLLGIGLSAYAGGLLGFILGAAVFSLPIGAMIVTCIFLGWILGLTALIVKYAPTIFTYCFSNQFDTSSLLGESDYSISRLSIVSHEPSPREKGEAYFLNTVNHKVELVKEKALSVEELMGPQSTSGDGASFRLK